MPMKRYGSNPGDVEEAEIYLHFISA